VTVYPSEAHRRIAELVAKKGPQWVEKRLELGDGTVRAWLRGRVPQARIQKRVAESLSITVDLWDAKSVSNASSPVEKREVNGATHPKTPRQMLVPASKAEVSARDPSDPKENAIATLRILRQALEEAEPDQIPSLANAVTSSSRLLARLSGALDVTEAQILRSGAWARLVKIVRDVLAKYPGAAAELDKSMAEYEARA
jgi:hypothetical protein